MRRYAGALVSLAALGLLAVVVLASPALLKSAEQRQVEAWAQRAELELQIEQDRLSYTGDRMIWYIAVAVVVLVVLVAAYNYHMNQARRRELLFPDEAGRYPLPDPRRVARELAGELLRELYAGHLAALVEASRQPAAAPHTYTYAPRIAGRGESAPAALASAGDLVDASGLPTAPAWAELWSSGWRPSADQMLLGYGKAGPIHGGIDALLSTAIAGRPGQGKTTALRFVYAQTVVAGGEVVILDPHGSIVDALGQGRAIWTASSKAELADGAEWLQAELERRNRAHQAGDRRHSPLLVLCDEWPVIGLQSKAAVEACSRVVLEARKWGVYALISGQGLPADRFGGSLVRDALSSRYIFKTTPAQARMAGLDKGASLLVEELDVGRAVLEGPVNPIIVAIPNTTATDLQLLGRPELKTPVAECLNGVNSASEWEELNSETVDVTGIVRRLRAENRGKHAIIELVWGTRPGGSKAFQVASREYDRIVATPT